MVDHVKNGNSGHNIEGGTHNRLLINFLEMLMQILSHYFCHSYSFLLQAYFCFDFFNYCVLSSSIISSLDFFYSNFY